MNQHWILRGRVFDPALAVFGFPGPVAIPFAVWGIVNMTPDSFFDGGQHCTADKAYDHAMDLVQEGAAVLDVGGASSRPGSVEISAAEECHRIMPLLHNLLAWREDKNTDSPATGPYLSVDTWRGEVAREMLEAGVDIINDISACAWDPGLKDILAQYRPGYVLMHCQGRPGGMQDAPCYSNVVDEVMAFFESTMGDLVRCGLPEENIVLDPGIGFGKKLEHNLQLLAALERFQQLGRPVFLGLSNKSLFGDLLGLAVDKRLTATGICTALAAERGVAHHRVHNVAQAIQALCLAKAFMPDAS